LPRRRHAVDLLPLAAADGAMAHSAMMFFSCYAAFTASPRLRALCYAFAACLAFCHAMLGH